VAVAAGRYGVGANLHNKCFGGDEITVLPGHDRDIGIEVVPFGGTVWDANASVSGTLPFKGFLRGTLSGRFGEEPIDVQGTAYYSERISVGSYTLKLEYGDGLECRIPVEISAYNEIKRLDISAQQMQQCIGYPYHYPGTGESGFIPLYRPSTPSPIRVNLPPSPSPS